MASESKRLKVAMIHQPWSIVRPPMRVADSIGIWVDEVARRLAVDCDVTCYSRRGKEQPKSERLANVEYRRVDARLDRSMRFLKLLDEKKVLSPERSFLSSPWFYRQYISRVSRELAKQDVDVIHVQNFSQYVPILRKRNPRAKIILHMHAEWLTDFDPRIIGPRLRQVDQVITCSNYFRDTIRNGWPQFADRCQTVYNGVSLREFAGVSPASETPGDEKRVLFVGRVCPEKGTHVLVDAFEKVLKRLPQAKLTIVGPLEMSKAIAINLSKEPSVRALAKLFETRGYLEILNDQMSPLGKAQIKITGEVSREQLIAAYARHELLVLPSIYAEGFGMPIAEAAFLKLPTVATRRGGIPEVVVDGKTGLLVEAGDADALAAALIRLLSDDGLRRSMGEAARRRVEENFTWEAVAVSLLKVYRDAMSSQAVPAQAELLALAPVPH